MAGCPLEQRVGGEVVGLTLEEVNSVEVSAYDCTDIYRRIHTSRLSRTSHYDIYSCVRSSCNGTYQYLHQTHDNSSRA